ncbi:uncharacterized protein LOC133336536 [Musca vetustissima]|uniref:uncharacterized protein LOC133336536 n=1 Tax=Musca vetustissima TaxID=27455 RepID=UPI002AB730DF|nr:uncharacterized protein LOC133336536 [Musca vetustissima]
MATHYSANQFEQAYASRRLGNWELPKWQTRDPPRPRQRKGSTQFIANERGHLLDSSKKLNQNPWGNFSGTYQLPDKLTRKFGDEYHKYLTATNHGKDLSDFGVSGTRLSYPNKCETLARVAQPNRPLHACEKKDSLDLEYIPGDFTSFKEQHPTRESLLENKYNRDYNIEPPLKLDQNLLGDHECKAPPNNCEPPPLKLTPILPQTSALVTSNLSPRIRDLDLLDNTITKTNQFSTNVFDNDSAAANMMGSQTITGKPNERCPSPVVPAHTNFELAKRMHQTNLMHNPLPDCVADLAFRRLQITGDNPGLALDIEPIASGVGVKTHNAGPTHCTKMKVYRPQTSRVVPRAYNTSDNFRSYSAAPYPEKKVGAMDLAICWDLPAQEPPRPRHIDGSNDSAGPAVFNFVKSPREDPPLNTGRSAGVFTNTLGETDFFDKDILRRKTDFGGHRIQTDDDLDLCRPMPRARSVSRDNSACHRIERLTKQFQSNPDISDQDYKALREKYLGPGCDFDSSLDPGGCKRPGFFRRARSRICHKVAPEPNCHHHYTEKRMPCKAAFRAGLPRFNAAGHFVSSDSGCSMGSHHHHSHPSQRVLVVPKPRNPYTKKNYDIDTLVPPFKSYAGGAGEGGYPEHWRLTSVYQQAYKPIQSRRKPLIQTVYK